MSADTIPDPELTRLRTIAAGGARAVRQAIDEAVAAERERIITLLQAQADRERQASDAFPGSRGLAGAARAARVAVLIARGEIGGEGLLP